VPKSTPKEREFLPTTSKVKKSFHLKAAITITRFLQVAQTITNSADLQKIQIPLKMEAFS
jgi:hypothetical protein